jgi:hypothetical protein
MLPAGIFGGDPYIEESFVDEGGDRWFFEEERNNP